MVGFLFRSSRNRNPLGRERPVRAFDRIKRKDGGSGAPSGETAAIATRGGASAPAPTFRIPIPEHVRPGEEFQVTAGGRVLRVRAPAGSKAGDSLQIAAPPDRGGSHRTPRPHHSSGGARTQSLEMNKDVPGTRVRVDPPPETKGSASTYDPKPLSHSISKSHNRRDGNMEMFEVQVPRGVKPGRPFTLLARGARILVTCPPNATSGQMIRFNLPAALLEHRPDGHKSKLAEIKLSYDKDGWSRIIRATDMKFQWTRFDSRGNVDERRRFNTERSAYVIKLEYLDDSRRIRRGRVSLVTPDKGVVDSEVKRADGSTLVGYSDIASTQMKGYEDKVRWLRDTCNRLRISWGKGHVVLHVRRQYLLDDSIHAVMSLSREDMRKTWRFNFIGEDGLDAGGLKREWFELVTKAAFDQNMGLWLTSTTNQMCMGINPASGMCRPEDHLLCFRFIGRVMGKALFDGELVKGHMVKHLYKHLLGWPVMFGDLEDLDNQIYNSLKGLKDMSADDLEYLCADFTATEELLGTRETVDLIPGGADIAVTQDNLPEYVEASLKYRLLGRYEAQLREMLLGFYDIIPKQLLTIFDFQELELLLCGLPEIDMNDWMTHTEYTGEYERDGASHEVCVWFWETVSGYDQEMKARLLQFVTGTSGVPSTGFSCLQGIDGRINNFTINGVELDTCVYPKSSTCFNRVYLPVYTSREELEEKLNVAITMAATGFDLE